MRVFLVALSILVELAIGNHAEAQNYPWCAVYGTPYGDTSCGFTSFEQCMASVNGIGGFCERNDTYRSPLAADPLRHQTHKSRTKHS